MKRSVPPYFSTPITFLALTAIAEGAGYKRLSTQRKGPNMVLDVIDGGNRNDCVRLSRKADVSGQAWTITKADDWLNLTTEFGGRNMCLDLVDGGSRDGMAQLAKCEDVAGQLWRLSDESAAEGAPPAPSHPGGAIPTAHILQAMTFPGDGDVPPAIGLFPRHAEDPAGPRSCWPWRSATSSPRTSS